MKHEALLWALPAARKDLGCQKEDLAPFQALASATLLPLWFAPFLAPSQLLAGPWPGFSGGCSPVVGAGPPAFGGCKLPGQSTVALETLAVV